MNRIYKGRRKDDDDFICVVCGANKRDYAMSDEEGKKEYCGNCSEADGWLDPAMATHRGVARRFGKGPILSAFEWYQGQVAKD